MAHEKSKNKGIFFIGACIFAYCAIHSLFVFEFGALEQYSSRMLAPFLIAHTTITTPIKQFLDHKRSVQELCYEVEQLKQERTDLLEHTIALQAQLAFVEHTQELTAFKKQYVVSQAVLAQVLLKNFSEQEHFFLVAAGLNQDVTKNMVAVYKNNLIGRVVEVFPTYSKVVLITDRACKVAAYGVQSGTTGIYEGTNELNEGALTHVSHLHTVVPDELLISSGDGLIFPQGFALGTVSSSSCTNLIYTITTKPLCDMRSIDYCYLLQKGAA